MATRFWFPNTGTSPVSPAFDAGWEQTGAGARFPLLPKLLLASKSTNATTSVTVPITTTQDILNRQYISDPLAPAYLSGTVQLVISCIESATTANAFLAIVINVVSQDGGTLRGNLFTAYGTDIEFGTSLSTRWTDQPGFTPSITPMSIQGGDRIVIELGVHAAAPTAATTAGFSFGNSATEATAASGTGGTNSAYCEFSQNIQFASTFNNYQVIKAADGMSTSGGIR